MTQSAAAAVGTAAVNNNHLDLLLLVLMNVGVSREMGEIRDSSSAITILKVLPSNDSEQIYEVKNIELNCV